MLAAAVTNPAAADDSVLVCYLMTASDISYPNFPSRRIIRLNDAHTNMNIDGPNRREDMGPSIYLMIMLASLDLDHQSLNI